MIPPDKKMKTRLQDVIRQRTLLGDGRQQAEDRQGDEEPIGSIAGGQAQRDAQSVPLGLRQRVERSEDRSA